MSGMSKDEYYMRLAQVTAMRATCDRLHVGAVLVHNDTVLSTGFNGAPRGMPECDDVGHLMIDGHCERTLHAEENAITEVGTASIRALDYVTLYTTTWPCIRCTRLIIQAGIKRVVYGAEYADETHMSDGMAYARDAAKEIGLEIEPFEIVGKP